MTVEVLQVLHDLAIEQNLTAIKIWLELFPPNRIFGYEQTTLNDAIEWIEGIEDEDSSEG